QTCALPILTVRGRQMQPVTGTVDRTATALDPVSRTLLTEVDIPNASHELFPGLFIYVGFAIGPSGSRWRVPATAVIIDAKGTRVATVAAGGKVHFQPVGLGRDFGAAIEIRAGLNGGEAIVAQGAGSWVGGQV